MYANLCKPGGAPEHNYHGADAISFTDLLFGDEDNPTRNFEAGGSAAGGVPRVASNNQDIVVCKNSLK